jgi:hypothetical protein
VDLISPLIHSPFSVTFIYDDFFIISGINISRSQEMKMEMDILRRGCSVRSALDKKLVRGQMIRQRTKAYHELEQMNIAHIDNCGCDWFDLDLAPAYLLYYASEWHSLHGGGRDRFDARLIILNYMEIRVVYMDFLIRNLIYW